ncbi:hypothetical protein JNW90_14925 [Micromonospora sp. STR1s_5]|nr:hypothetical protein [Micromonospora sp. STR1s_5]
MGAETRLVWLVQCDPHTREPDLNEGIVWDCKVPVGKVRLASGDPLNRGAWRWSMFAYGRHCQGAASVSRAGGAETRDQAKADCEAAYLKLLAAHPDNRDAIHNHHSAVEERAPLFESGEGLSRAREPDAKG